MLLALLLMGMVSGCSAVKLGYNNATSLGTWWLDSYLDLDGTQSLQLHSDLTALQTWHRLSELPAYLGTLKKLQRMAPGNVSPEQVCDVYGALKTHLSTFIEQTEATILALAPSLKTEQLSHLARQFDKRNLKWRTEWMEGSPTEREARRLKLWRGRIEMLYGKLDEPQWAVLRSHGAMPAFDASVNYRETLRRQQDTLQTLRQLQGGALTEARAKAEVRALLVRTLASPNAAYRNYADHLMLESCKTLAALHNSSTPAQRLQMMETLKDYETDARALMASKP